MKPRELSCVADVLRTIEEEGKKLSIPTIRIIPIRLNEQLQDIYTAIILKNPAIWIYWLNDIKLHRDELSNPTEADYHITKAEKAVGDGDIEGA